MKRVAIIQSSYLPWRGLFAAIAQCDCFVFLDSVQFTRRDWRTRNTIKTPQGVHWLSVPVMQKGNFHSSIDEVQIAEPNWWKTHLKSIELNYRRAHHFRESFPLVEQLFESVANTPTLSEMNQTMTMAICQMLGVKSQFSRDVDLLPREALVQMSPTDRLVKLAMATGASVYLSGPSAKNYLDEHEFNAMGMSVEWMEYSKFQEPYRQLWGAFVPSVSIVDTVLNLGLEQTREVVLQRGAA